MFRGPIMEDPVTLGERLTAASKCLKDLNLPIPAVIDRMDNKVNLAYGGWPDRLYLVGKDGKITYAGGQGPFGFKPDEIDAAIRAELKKIKKAKVQGL